jgi:hypothetical protein
MGTAKDYFTQSPYLQLGKIVRFSHCNEEFDVHIQVVQDFEGGSKYLKTYIPEIPRPEVLLACILEQRDELIWKYENDLQIESGMAGTNEAISSRDLSFSGRVLVYTPSIIDVSRWDTIKTQMKEKGLNLLVRDGAYAKGRSENDKPLAFISHDSRDKEAFVRELAEELSRNLCPVWYDEYRLKLGDSLRERIEAGLKACPRCIIVLSKNFLSNPGWTKTEFNAVFTREIIKRENVIIPIWLDVTLEDVYDYSPALADRVATQASLGVKEVASRLISELKS